MSKRDFTPIHKASSNSETKTPNYTEKGQPGIGGLYRFIQDLTRTELQMPQRFCTVDQMCQDSAVSNSIRFRTDLLVQAMNEGVTQSTGTPASDIAAKFLEHNLRNMSVGSWLQAMRDAATYLKYGFSPLNIVMEKRTYGKYKGSVCLKKLAPRSQKALYGWVWDDNYRELKGFVMKPMVKSLRSSSLGSYGTNITTGQLTNGYYKDQNYPFFKTNEFLLFSYNSTLNNPQGELLAASCFESYLEKKIIEQYELSGIAKDLGGIIVARSPSDLFEKANNPEEYPEAAVAKQEFETDLANMHSSKTTFVHLQSDRDDHGQYQYDFELKGVSGGGSKAYNTSEIIKDKTKAIYNSFMTQALLAGLDGSGSLALSQDQMTTFQYAVQRDYAEMADVINTQLFPRILAANGIYLDHEDMPVFVPLSPFKVTYDEAGKFGQRIKSVGLMTPALYKYLLEDLGAPIEGIEDIDFTADTESRAGDGMKTAGEGTAKTVGGSDKSVANNENGGVSKSLNETCTEAGTDRIINIDTGKCINSEDLDENGHYK